MAYGRDRKSEWKGKKPQKSNRGGGGRKFALFLNWDEDKECYLGEFKGERFKAAIKDNGDMSFKHEDNKTKIAEAEENDIGEYWVVSIKGVTCYANEGESEHGEYLRVRPTEFIPFGEDDEEEEEEKPRRKKSSSSRKKSSRNKRSREEDDDEDEEEEEDEKPKRKKKTSRRKKSDDDVDEVEFEGPAKKSKPSKKKSSSAKKESAPDFDNIPF